MRHANGKTTPWAKVGASVLAAAVLFGAAACADERTPTDNEVTPSADPTPTESFDWGLPTHPVLLLEPHPDGRDLPTGNRFLQVGSADVEVAVSSLEGGDVETVPGQESAAFRFPTYEGGGSYPRAVLIARNSGAGDSLTPGARRFTYGADFKLDRESVGRPEDNGNNVVQRGLSSDRVMFKLDVDADLRPGCTVKSVGGSITVHVEETVEPERWYRVRCERRGSQVLVTVAQFLPSGDITTTAARMKEGQLGDVTFPNLSVPVSVGGKVAHDGTVIASGTDQFNGEIANPFLAIG